MFTASQPTILRFSYRNCQTEGMLGLTHNMPRNIDMHALLFRCIDLATIGVYDCVGGKVTTGVVCLNKFKLLSTIHSSYICKLTTVRDQQLIDRPEPNMPFILSIILFCNS